MPFKNIEFLNKQIREFLLRLVRDYEEIVEVWLFGSRAQAEETAGDWDLLIVALDQGATLNLVGANLSLRKEAERQNIHLFMLGKDKDPLGDYICPWKRKGSKGRDKFNLRRKISWIDSFDFQYSGENAENIGMCIWKKTSDPDSLLNFHFYR